MSQGVRQGMGRNVLLGGSGGCWVLPRGMGEQSRTGGEESRLMQLGLWGVDDKVGRDLSGKDSSARRKGSQLILWVVGVMEEI